MPAVFFQERSWAETSIPRGQRDDRPSHRSLVVPAEAGTHNHRAWLLRESRPTACFTTGDTAYGSLLPQGRRENEPFIDALMAAFDLVGVVDGAGALGADRGQQFA